MSKVSPSTPALNRLRAAAGLVHLIEIDISHPHFSQERVVSMLAFCGAAIEHKLVGDPEAERLTGIVLHGIDRIQKQLR